MTLLRGRLRLLRALARRRGARGRTARPTPFPRYPTPARLVFAPTNYIGSKPSSCAPRRKGLETQMKAQTVGSSPGTDSSNPPPSSGESAANRHRRARAQLVRIRLSSSRESRANQHPNQVSSSGGPEGWVAHGRRMARPIGSCVMLRLLMPLF